jgi:hypothetical protein
MQMAGLRHQNLLITQFDVYFIGENYYEEVKYINETPLSFLEWGMEEVILLYSL